MSVQLRVRNESNQKRLCRQDALQRQAERICHAEGLHDPLELSLLLCDDPRIQELNKTYRHTDSPTDVLSFEQDCPEGIKPRPLGDIVISLETVHTHCAGDRPGMREEIRLLFCHGLLHLLGYDHGSAAQRAEMTAKQSEYLDLPAEAAWKFGPRNPQTN